MESGDLMKSFNKMLIPIVSLILLSSYIIHAATVSAETVLQLTKEEAQEITLENNNTIKSLDQTRKELLRGYSDLSDQMDLLEGLYNNLNTFEHLYTKNKNTRDNVSYNTYFENSKQILTNTMRIEEIDEILSSPTDDVDIESLTNEKNTLVSENETYQNEITALGLTESEINNIISYEEYQNLQILQAQFGSMNINKPLSKEEEYSRFIKPLYVTPYSFQMNITSMNLTIETTKESILSGVNQLYDGILTLKEVKTILIESVALNESNLNNSQVKLQLGKATKVDVTKAKNNLEIARMELQKMEREINSMKMNLKKMLGLEPTTTINLIDEVTEVHNLQDLYYYIGNALTNRNEIKLIQLSIEDKNNEFDYVDEYFSSRSEEYLIGESELKGLYLDLEYTKLDIEKEIRNAYMDVKEKKAAYELSIKELDQAITQYNNMQSYKELGYITSNTLNQLNIQKVQKENAKITAYRNYVNAYQALIDATSIGPAYSFN